MDDSDLTQRSTETEEIPTINERLGETSSKYN